MPRKQPEILPLKQAHSIDSPICLLSISSGVEGLAVRVVNSYVLHVINRGRWKLAAEKVSERFRGFRVA